MLGEILIQKYINKLQHKIKKLEDKIRDIEKEKIKLEQIIVDNYFREDNLKVEEQNKTDDGPRGEEGEFE